MRERLVRLARHVPAGIWLGVLTQTAFLVTFAATDAYDAARTGEAFRLVATFVSVVALFGFLHVAFATRARVPLFLAFFFLVLVNFAKLETTGTFDYAFVHENISELGNPLGRRIVTAHIAVLDVVLALVLPLVLGGYVIRRMPLVALSWRSRVLASALCAAFVVVFPLVRQSTHEPLSTFVRQAYRFHDDAHRYELTGEAPLPFVHRSIPSERARAIAGSAAPRPPVIVLFLESWSDIYTDRTGVDGQPFTPVYDRERRDALSFQHFYGSSIQSSRGRFATMCSLIPLYRGKEFKDLAGAPLHCLPHVMRETGYTTFIYSASDEPEFEDSTAFFGHLGFGEVVFEDRARRGKDPNVWGVGLQDDAYYRKLFAMVDAKMAADPAAPVFAVGINGSHHYPFHDNPAQMPSASGTTKRARDFLGSLHAADAWLSVFFEELGKRPQLKDALVVLVGDHSFPADEHGIHFNGLGAREESFRTAFALRWKGHVEPRLVGDRTASQIDVAPTIIDLLQLDVATPFVGRSLVADDGPGPPAPMVQPYDGIRLAAVLYPFKLEVHEAAEREHLYDLSTDPDERIDRLGDVALAPTAALLRQTIDRIRRSQAILRAHRIWPEDGRLPPGVTAP
ncbi:MAG: Phosphoglycerol transferase [Labilithrix sp.]|nr:Phosphoglycerol transferase [Labilithrix sp.]